jgi:predicted AlkP superfamily pyrophosphatase or phosphodiesterase
VFARFPLRRLIFVIRPLRSPSAAALLAPLLGLLASPILPAQERTAAPRPSLLVVVTVDQLRPEYLERWDGQFRGGFRRLIDEGAFFVRAVQDHGVTETAPGHASILSGRFPYSTGIASNSAGVNTTASPLVDAEGNGAAPFRFQGTTLADWMAAAEPQTRMLSVSRKDRGAILPIGRGSYPVFWYAQSTGGFTTSTWYADSLPAWVRAFNAEQWVTRRYAGRLWDLLEGIGSYPELDETPAEARSQEPRFPHRLPADPMLARNLIIGFPYMDELTLDFAWAGVRALELGQGPQTDLLAVSLSTTDAVGHRWGPDSREVHDHLLRLDRMLGLFLDSLAALRGGDRIVVALTADHGVAPSPDGRSSWGDNRRASRVSLDDFSRAFQSAMPYIASSGIPADAFDFDGFTLAVDRARAPGKDRVLQEIATAFANEARRVPGVMRADVLDRLSRADTVKDAVARRWLHSFRPGGDVLAVVTLEPYHIFDGGNTATHGSPHDYDAQVPLILWGAPFQAGRRTESVRVVDLAPTLAELLGISPLERLDGHPLNGVRRP